MRRIFFTGGTGFLGSYLSYLLAQKGFQITLLVRNSRTQSGKERYLEALKVLFSRLDLKLIDKRIEFVHGDILEDNFALSHLEARWDVFLHCAASTDFNESNADNLRKTNLEGTSYAVRFARHFKIPSFHYISTAYSSGDVKGRVKEIIQVPPSFRNLYEETKNQAERICFSFCKENNIRLTIHRPSIIIGETKEGRTLNFEGPYLFFKQFVRLYHFVRRKQHLKPSEKVRLEIKVPAFAEDEQNFVPVDYVASFVTAVLEREALEGQIYHVTNLDPPTLGDLKQVFMKLIPFEGVSFLGDQAAAADNKEETLFMTNMRAYAPYLKTRVTFDKTNAQRVEQLAGVSCPRLTHDLLSRLFEHSLKTNFGKRTLGEPFEPLLAR